MRNIIPVSAWGFALAAGCLAAAPQTPPAPPPAWVLPNFAQRLELEVANPSGVPVETLAIVPVAVAGQVALRFPGTLAVVVLPDAIPEIVPSQADDLDGDGNADEFVFPVKLAPHQSRAVHIYYSTTLRDEIPWPRRVAASHAYGYNRATAGLESEVIGYRTYGGFFLDIQARAAGRPGLYNALVGYSGTRAAGSLGRDVIHIGSTLGLGGLFLRAGGTVFQPPLNMPDYAHKPEAEEVPHYRVVASGPVRAMFEARMESWHVGTDEVEIRALYSIAAGAAHAECRFTIVPRRVSREYEAGAGIRHLPEMKTAAAPGRLALAGNQAKDIGPLGLALYYDTGAARAAAPLATREGTNECVIFNGRLAPGRTVSGRYQVAAAWSGSGIADLLGYLAGVEPAARATVTVSGFRFARTPNPQRVEGEAD